MGAGALVYTGYEAYVATPCKQADWLLALAVLWGVLPPLWWWYEFFFIYPPHHSEQKFELLKQAAHASLAIWAPVAVALAAYASSDYFKPPEPGQECVYKQRQFDTKTIKVSGTAMPASSASFVATVPR